MHAITSWGWTIRCSVGDQGQNLRLLLIRMAQTCMKRPTYSHPDRSSRCRDSPVLKIDMRERQILAHLTLFCLAEYTPRLSLDSHCHLCTLPGAHNSAVPPAWIYGKTIQPIQSHLPLKASSTWCSCLAQSPRDTSKEIQHISFYT